MAIQLEAEPSILFFFKRISYHTGDATPYFVLIYGKKYAKNSLYTFIIFSSPNM